MITQVLVNNVNKNNKYIKGIVELQLLKNMLKDKTINEDAYYYLKEVILKEYQIF